MRRISATERVANHLREELLRGSICDPLPGVHALTAALGANHNTVDKALRLLEQEGVLVAQGPGRRRRIAVGEGKVARPLRVAILAFDPPAVELAEGYMADLLHRLSEAGHNVYFAEKCLLELGMDVGRVARLVRRTDADAWVVGAGSRGVLEWFAAQVLPVFALFGRRGGLPIAGVGPDHVAAGIVATRRLIELGHRRIVQMVRRNRRLPVPGKPERAILDEMAAHGITTGPFNLPDWEETGAGFHACLQELFRVTPPTALIIEEAPFMVAAIQFLGRRGLRVPEDVSLVCTDADPAFAFCEPTIAHIRWDGRPVVQRVVRWAANVSHGREDRRQTLTKAEFVEGGTVGPVMG